MNITRELMSGSRWEIQLNSQFIQKKMLQNIEGHKATYISP